MKIDNFFAELKRRNVYKVAVAYAVAGWALAQGIAQVFPVFGVPNWIIQLVVLLIVVGFPIALVLAWAFELNARRTKTNRRCRSYAAAAEISGLDLCRCYRRCFVDRVIFCRPLYRGKSKRVGRRFGKSIAVLPFENISADKENSYFADGVQDQILTNLAKVSDLKVISHTSSRQYKTGVQRNLREIGKQLGVAYIVEVPCSGRGTGSALTRN